MTLAFETEVEVGLVEDVDSNVTVLTTWCVAGSVGMEHDTVDGTEVTFHTRELFVVENLNKRWKYLNENLKREKWLE